MVQGLLESGSREIDYQDPAVGWEREKVAYSGAGVSEILISDQIQNMF